MTPTTQNEQRAETHQAKSHGDYSKPTISKLELDNAVNASCLCGGGGPEDPHTCPACMVYHRLVTLSRKND